MKYRTHLYEYALRETTSGAIQYGVPTIVVRFEAPSLSWAQKPKSAVSLCQQPLPLLQRARNSLSLISPVMLRRMSVHAIRNTFDLAQQGKRRTIRLYIPMDDALLM